MTVTLLWVGVHPRGVEERGGDVEWVDRGEETQRIARHAIEPGGHTYLKGKGCGWIVESQSQLGRNRYF